MEKIKKYDNLLLWIGMLVFALITILQIPISVNDELWNFQNIYKMMNGYTIYEDANVIITPIFFWISEVFFKLIGGNYFIYRVLDAIIYSTMLLVIYNILKQLKVTKRKALMYTLIIHYFIYPIITAGANYNFLAITFVLIGIYIMLKYYNTNKFIWLNSIIIYLTIFTKQNIGIYYLIATTVIQIILNKNKTYGNIIKQIGIMLTLSGLTLGIFYFNGNLNRFIDYAFLGIGEFATSNIGIELTSILCFGIYIIISVCTVIIYKKIANQDQKQNIIIFSVYGLFMTFIAYPIANELHTIIAILVGVIMLVYMTNIVIEELLSKKIINIVISSITIIFVILSTKSMIAIYNNNPFSSEYKNPYFGVYISDEIQIKINNVNKYIKENKDKVIIFSDKAALYNVPEKRSNGAMDLPFLGNLGYGGEKSMLENIKSKKGYKILLSKEKFWQESEMIIKYIKENYEKVGEIEEFEIYQII